MYFYLYKTICLVTNKYYIGVHSTKNLNDGYLGSGLLLQRSLKKYGKENHQKEILEFFQSKIDMFKKESEIVTIIFLTDSNCLNIKPGGSGGWASNENKIKALENSVLKQNWLYKNDAKWANNRAIKISNSLKKTYLNDTRKIENNNHLKNKARPLAILNAQTIEAKQKRIQTLQQINHQQGEKNSQYGTCWVSNNVHTIKISIELLEEYISKGYIRGRKLNCTNKKL